MSWRNFWPACQFLGMCSDHFRQPWSYFCFRLVGGYGQRSPWSSGLWSCVAPWESLSNHQTCTFFFDTSTYSNTSEPTHRRPQPSHKFLYLSQNTIPPSHKSPGHNWSFPGWPGTRFAYTTRPVSGPAQGLLGRFARLSTTRTLNSHKSHRQTPHK